MKPSAFALMLAFVMLALAFVVPTLSNAGTSSNQIVASFERDLNREAVSTYTTHRDVDTVQYLVNNTLRNGSDQIVASFERDLNREAVSTYTTHRDVDTVQYLVNNTLRNGSNQIVASFERDLNAS